MHVLYSNIVDKASCAREKLSVHKGVMFLTSTMWHLIITLMLFLVSLSSAPYVPSLPEL
jgi:hypothetical protein